MGGPPTSLRFVPTRIGTLRLCGLLLVGVQQLDNPFSGREEEDKLSCFGNAVIVFVAVIVAALVASAIGTNTRASIIGALVVFFGIWIGGWYLIHRMTNRR